MQSLLLALRRAGAGSLNTSVRQLSAATTEGAASSGAASAAEQWGAKSKLMHLLGGRKHPLTAAELWEKAQAEGFKSKRFMKTMLQEMKESGFVKTQRLAGIRKHVKSSRYFGYLLAPSKQSRQPGARAPQSA